MWQVILVTLIGGLAGVESVLDEWQLHRPLIACTLVGLVMGNVHTGLIIGAELELVALGWMNIGASQSPDTALASVISTILATRGGHDVNDAIALGVPLAVAGNLTTVLVRTLTVTFQHRADAIGPNSSRRYLTWLHFSALSLQFLRVALPAFVVVEFVNPAMIRKGFELLPPVLSNGFSAASGFIVVVGYAMVIRSLQAKQLMPYLILGFLLADYTHMPLIAIGIAAVCIAYLHVRLWTQSDQLIGQTDVAYPVHAQSLPRRVLWRTFWRSQFEQASWNYERMQSLGYAYILEPGIDALFPNPDKRATRKKRHLEFFNSQPYVANVVVGINLALEELVAADVENADRLVTSMKLGMMGPLAGVGDSIFWGTLRPLFASFGATLALRGQVIGPILFFVLWNVVRLATRWGLLIYGYRLGTRIVNVIQTGILRQITQAATIVGLFVMGALVADWTHVRLAPAWNLGHGHVIRLDDIVQSVLPGLPSFLLLLFVMWLFGRGWSSVKIILLLFVFGIAGVAIHLLLP